jgi:hypothetical protein
MKVVPDGFGGIAGDNGGQGLGGGLLRVAEAAEVSEEAPAGLGADAGDGKQFGVAVPHGAALATAADGQAAAFPPEEWQDDPLRHGAMIDPKS